MVGTPGTVLDWILKKKALDPSKIVLFVLDEADIMIATQGHQDQTIRIHKWAQLSTLLSTPPLEPACPFVATSTPLTSPPLPSHPLLSPPTPLPLPSSSLPCPPLPCPPLQDCQLQLPEGSVFGYL